MIFELFETKSPGCFEIRPRQFKDRLKEIVESVKQQWNNIACTIDESAAGCHEANFLKLDCSK